MGEGVLGLSLGALHGGGSGFSFFTGGAAGAAFAASTSAARTVRLDRDAATFLPANPERSDAEGATRTAAHWDWSREAAIVEIRGGDAG
jgi:hypothetical protein